MKNFLLNRDLYHRGGEHGRQAQEQRCVCRMCHGINAPGPGLANTSLTKKSKQPLRAHYTTTFRVRTRFVVLGDMPSVWNTPWSADVNRLHIPELRTFVNSEPAPRKQLQLNQIKAIPHMVRPLQVLQCANGGKGAQLPHPSNTNRSDRSSCNKQRSEPNSPWK